MRLGSSFCNFGQAKSYGTPLGYLASAMARDGNMLLLITRFVNRGRNLLVSSASPYLMPSLPCVTGRGGGKNPSDRKRKRELFLVPQQEVLLHFTICSRYTDFHGHVLPSIPDLLLL